jgi:hypothetical protein
MTCDDSNLLASTSSTNGGSVTCTVATQMEGSMLEGTFKLSTMYPSEYIATPSPYNTSNLAWNIEASELDSILEAVVDSNGDKTFGYMQVSRSVYIPSAQVRWSGGYTWTLTFSSRIGNVPALSLDKTNLADQGSSGPVTLEVSDEASGAYDTYQGAADSSTFSVDDPGTAIDGGQVWGSFGLSFDGVTTSATAFPIQNPTTYLATSAAELKTLIDT